MTETNEESLERVQRECAAMMKLLAKLEQEELDLRAQNEILARNALLCGFAPGMLEPPAPKRRRKGAAKQDDAKEEK